MPRTLFAFLFSALFFFVVTGCKSGDAAGSGAGGTTSFTFSTADMSGIWAFRWNDADLSNIQFSAGGDITWTDDGDITSGILTIRSTANIDGRFVLSNGVMSLDGTLAQDKKSISGTFTTNPGNTRGTWTATRVSNVILLQDGFSDSSADPLIWQALVPGGGNTPYVAGGAMRILTDGVTAGDTGLITTHSVSAGGNFRVQVEVNASECVEDCVLALKIYNNAVPDTTTSDSDETATDTAVDDTTDTTDTTTEDSCASFTGLYNDSLSLSLEMTNVFNNTMSGAFSAGQITACAATDLPVRMISTKNSGTLLIDFINGTFTLSFTETGGSQQTLAQFSTEGWTLPAQGMSFLVALTGTSVAPAGINADFAVSGAGFFFDNLKMFLLN